VINEYVETIVRLLEDKEFKNKLIEEGKKDIKELNWKNIVPKYKEIFEK
jgi:glycosyltransferase involved in cell wall biosynthesis